MAQLIGLARIGRDAETRYTAQGDAVTELSLAFTYGKKDQDGKRPTQWVKGSFWGQRGEALRPYLLKGTMLYVVIDEAHVQTFQKQDGSHGAALVGKINSVEFASRPDTAGQSQSQAQQQHQPAQQQRQQRPSAPAAPPSAGGLADMDDDIPFRQLGAGRAYLCI